ncbi:MAG: superoxide dismutase, Ni [Myxococcales bacterium FL481]|nr:MAG: superoxide dismutase, Ni [Myxococcales bacterium FL481]
MTGSKTVSAHCDGPCGIYDPASARVAAEAVLSMTNKLLALSPPAGDDPAAHAAYLNTFARYVTIKESQAELAKSELLILWTDYFKPPHLEANPDLHTTFWEAAKLCSACKQEISSEKANALLERVRAIHDVFWQSKGRDVPWMTAG